jgi:hypothetical protein
MTARLLRAGRWLRVIAAARRQKCEGTRSLRPASVRARWRFEGEEVFAGPEDRFDPLADGRDMRPCSAFLLAARAREGGVRCGDLGHEAVAGVAAVAEQDLAAAALAAATAVESPCSSC